MRYYIAKDLKGEIVATRTAATKEYQYAVLSRGVWKREGRPDQPWSEANWASNMRLAQQVAAGRKHATEVEIYKAIEVEGPAYRKAAQYLKDRPQQR